MFLFFILLYFLIGNYQFLACYVLYFYNYHKAFDKDIKATNVSFPAIAKIEVLQRRKKKCLNSF